MIGIRKFSSYAAIVLSWMLVAVMLIDQHILTLNNRLFLVIFLLISMLAGVFKSHIENKRKLQYNLQELEDLNMSQWVNYILMLYKMNGYTVYPAPLLPGETNYERLILKTSKGKQVIWCQYYQKEVTAYDLKHIIGTLCYFHAQSAAFISKESVKIEEQKLMTAHNIKHINQEELLKLKESAQLSFKQRKLKPLNHLLKYTNQIEKPVIEHLSPLAYRSYMTQLAGSCKKEAIKADVSSKIAFILKKGQKRYGVCFYSIEEKVTELELYDLVVNKPFINVEGFIVVTVQPLDKACCRYCRLNHIKVFSPLAFKRFCQLEQLKTNAATKA